MPFTLFASVIMMILKRTHFLFGTSFLPSPPLPLFFFNYFFFFRIILFRPINFWVSAFTYLLYCSVYRIINCQIILAKESFCSMLCSPHPFFYSSYLLASAVRFWWSPFVLYSWNWQRITGDGYAQWYN